MPVTSSSDVQYQPERLLKLTEVAERLGFRRERISRLVAEGRFPKPARLGERNHARVWRESEVNDWIRRLFGTDEA
jgi:prophage regulatory protein